MSEIQGAQFAMDRRAWVIMVDQQLPQMEIAAAAYQMLAADSFKWYDKQPWEVKKAHEWMLRAMQESYRDAMSMTTRCVYFKAMRAANYREEDWI